LNATDNESTDTVDSGHIYQIIEEKVIPLYYERDIEGIPHKWLRMMKESIRSIPPFFNTRRMAKEYTRSMYLNAADHLHTEDNNTEGPLSASDYSI
jgi:starch phosphorylase